MMMMTIMEPNVWHVKVKQTKWKCMCNLGQNERERVEQKT